jgi:16S rRNA (cytosine967-C5)-methyltransferase
MDPARTLAFQVLSRLAAGAGWRAAWKQAAASRTVASRDRRFALEIASGTTRLRARLDAAIARHAGRRVETLDVPVVVLLRMGLYQLFEADGVAPHAAVHTTVELAKRYAARAAGFVNAVLRSATRAGWEWQTSSDDPALLAAAWSHPEWIVRRWLERFGRGETEALCAYDNRRPELCLRVNVRRTRRDDLLAALPAARAGVWSAAAIRLERAAYAPARAAVEAGQASVQDESAMLVAPALGPQPGERLVDVAAAPGGKTCHLSELMDGTGTVRAFDRTDAKLRRVRDNAARLGLTNISTVVADARTLPPQDADGVLVDAPCSGFGVLSRRPDLRWRKQPADLVRLHDLQCEILAAASRSVRPGGRLVYSVCSFEPEETSAVVAWFASRHADFVPDDDGLDLRCGPGISYSLPQRHGMDGGFVARWRRAV